MSTSGTTLLADDYVRALWWVLALVSDTGSIDYQVLPGVRRDQLLGDLRAAENTALADWARPVRRIPDVHR